MNVSVRRAIEGVPLGTRCEVKNLNGLRFLVGAIGWLNRSFPLPLSIAHKLPIDFRIRNWPTNIRHHQRDICRTGYSWIRSCRRRNFSSQKQGRRAGLSIYARPGVRDRLCITSSCSRYFPIFIKPDPSLSLQPTVTNRLSPEPPPRTTRGCLHSTSIAIPPNPSRRLDTCSARRGIRGFCRGSHGCGIGS